MQLSSNFRYLYFNSMSFTSKIAVKVMHFALNSPYISIEFHYFSFEIFYKSNSYYIEFMLHVH